MPSPAGVSTAPWRRWASWLHLIVTDDGATIDFYGGDDDYDDPTILDLDELEQVTDRDLICLLTPAVEAIILKGCVNLTDASIAAVAENCPQLAELNVQGCRNLTDASIAAVAENCPQLVALGVQECENLTDTSISAVAEMCPHLANLRVAMCGRLTDASITAVAEKCANLTELHVGLCQNLTDVSITAVAENCPRLAMLYVWGCWRLTDASIATVAETCANLTMLNVCGCELTALPANIGKLSRLDTLLARRNQLKELPRSIAKLDASCDLGVHGNPLQLPPLEIATQGIPAIKRYFEEHDDTA